MIMNMPAGTFIFYVLLQIVVIVFVIAYGIWWMLKGKKSETKKD